jgi:DnaJ-domain-containing protein 1
MTDFFALLGEPRRPWLDPEALKAKFLALTAEAHPDRVHNSTPAEKQSANERYVELNAAYQCLREPKERLIHLLELERGTRPEGVQRIPPATADLFMNVNQLCHEADALLLERARTSSPILKLRLFENGMALGERLNALLQRLNAKRNAFAEQMKDLNMAWESAPPAGAPTRVNSLPCDRLERLYRDLSYLTRWSQQIQERILQLSF